VREGKGKGGSFSKRKLGGRGSSAYSRKKRRKKGDPHNKERRGVEIKSKDQL